MGAQVGMPGNFAQSYIDLTLDNFSLLVHILEPF